MAESTRRTSAPEGGIRSPVWLLLGCTAAGKTDVALALAAQFELEIVSVDSMQVYRRMDIGTAKPSREQRARVPHHLVGVIEPHESFTAARFVELADAAVADIQMRGRTPLLVAGTPFYLMAFLYGMFKGPSADESYRSEVRARAAREGPSALYDQLVAIDPAAAARIHPNDLHRIERALEVHFQTGRRISELQREWEGPPRYAVRAVGLRRSRDDLAHRINARVRSMIEAGLVDEVRALLAEPGGLSVQARQALGYAQIMDHLEGGASLADAVETIKIGTRRLAKSQRTWFRRFRQTEWLDVEPDEAAASISQRVAACFAGG
ncbi:MAG: tRNA (adenosine(37)-N6)-dimethylallyltransferase MiaA [Phycisphaerae bacterium]